MKLRIIPLFFLTLGSLPAADPTTQTAAQADASIPSPEAVALFQSGRKYLKGDGVEKDAAKAVELMRQSAELGHVPAMTAVGYLYSAGKGVRLNDLEASKWFRMAADKGDAVAQVNLGRLLVNEKLPLPTESKDRLPQYAEGIEWIRKAADQGNTEARLAYGIILMRGDYESKPQPAKAAGYLTPLAEAGDLEAMNALGVMYESGNGVAFDEATAERWFRKAAMGGNLKAQTNLGSLLGLQSPNRERRIEALGWLFLAEEAKEVMAPKILQDNLPAVAPAEIAAGRAKAAELKKLLPQKTK
jgi:uncharacterized protein